MPLWERFEIQEMLHATIGLNINNLCKSVKSVVKKKELTVETLKEVILHYAEGKKYFSMEMLKKVLAAEKYDFAKQTLKQNLNHLTKEKTIFDAGRGWYSTLPETLKLDKSTLEPTVQNILEQFPLSFLD